MVTGIPPQDVQEGIAIQEAGLRLPINMPCERALLKLSYLQCCHDERGGSYSSLGWSRLNVSSSANWFQIQFRRPNEPENVD